MLRTPEWGSRPGSVTARVARPSVTLSPLSRSAAKVRRLVLVLTPGPSPAEHPGVRIVSERTAGEGSGVLTPTPAGAGTRSPADRPAATIAPGSSAGEGPGVRPAIRAMTP